MAERTGNWFTGYSGRSTYIPDSYKWGGSSGEYGFNPYNEYDQLSQQGVSLGNMLMRRARGEWPSAAEMSMLRAMQGMRGAMTGAPSGMSPALAARMAGQQASGMIGQQAMLRAQEQAQAQQSLADYLMRQLTIRAEGATSREQLIAQMLAEKNRLLMQQDLANAQSMTRSGFGNELMAGLGAGINLGATIFSSMK